MASNMVLGQVGGGSTSAPASGRGNHESAVRPSPGMWFVGIFKPISILVFTWSRGL